jgi:hypothetical protein
MEDVHAGIVTASAPRFAFDLDLPDKGSDGLDGVWRGKLPDDWQPCVRETLLNALADGPDLRLARQ